jgi:hypothetical protein
MPPAVFYFNRLDAPDCRHILGDVAHVPGWGDGFAVGRCLWCEANAVVGPEDQLQAVAQRAGLAGVVLGADQN